MWRPLNRASRARASRARASWRSGYQQLATPAQVGVAGLLPEPLAFTGALPELLIIDPVLSGALLALAVWIVDPAWLQSQ